MNKKILLIMFTFIMSLLLLQGAVVAKPISGTEWEFTYEVKTNDDDIKSWPLPYVGGGTTTLSNPSPSTIQTTGSTWVFPASTEIRATNFLWASGTQIGWDADVQYNSTTAYASAGTFTYDSSKNYKGETYHWVRFPDGGIRASWTERTTY